MTRLPTSRGRIRLLAIFVAARPGIVYDSSCNPEGLRLQGQPTENTLPISTLDSINSRSFVGGNNLVTGAVLEVQAGDAAMALHGAGSHKHLARAIEAVVNFATTPAPIPATNRTAEWMKAHGKLAFESITKFLNGKMVRSKELGVVEDHIQTLFTRLIERDTLSQFLAEGRTVKMSVLRVWAYQSACTELRRWGVDAALRATRNAKTSREVQQGVGFRQIQSPNAARQVTRNRQHSTQNGTMNLAPNFDLYDPSAPSPEESASRNSRVDEVRRALVRMGQPHLVPVVDGLLEGRSLTEIQETYGVTRDQITKVLQGIRA